LRCWWFSPASSIRSALEPVRALAHVHGHFHVLAELAKDGDHPVDREAFQLGVADARDDLGGKNGARLLKITDLAALLPWRWAAERERRKVAA
jgi:hypothetical protein